MKQLDASPQRRKPGLSIRRVLFKRPFGSEANDDPGNPLVLDGAAWAGLVRIYGTHRGVLLVEFLGVP